MIFYVYMYINIIANIIMSPVSRKSDQSDDIVVVTASATPHSHICTFQA